MIEIIEFNNIPVLIIELSPTGKYKKGLYKEEVRIFSYYRDEIWIYEESYDNSMHWFFKDPQGGNLATHTNLRPNDERDLNWFRPYLRY